MAGSVVFRRTEQTLHAVSDRPNLWSVVISAWHQKNGKNYQYLWKDDSSWWWQLISYLKIRPTGEPKLVLNGWKREYCFKDKKFVYKWWFPKPKNQSLGDTPEDFVQLNLEDWLPLLQADFQQELLSRFQQFKEAA